MASVAQQAVVVKLNKKKNVNVISSVHAFQLITFKSFYNLLYNSVFLCF